MTCRAWRMAKWLFLPLAILAVISYELALLPKRAARLGRLLARPWIYCKLRGQGWETVGPYHRKNRRVRR